MSIRFACRNVTTRINDDDDDDEYDVDDDDDDDDIRLQRGNTISFSSVKENFFRTSVVRLEETKVIDKVSRPEEKRGACSMNNQTH